MTRPAPVRVVASFYGKAHHGRKTASGEAFDRWGMTCAHRTLKLGSWVRLREPQSQRVCLARVTDRGPYTRGRDLDVSEAVARALHIETRGVATLEMEVLR
jgi:rare lipoprotein A